MGWVRDAWRIPSYVALANGDAQFAEELRVQLLANPRAPPLRIAGLIAQLLFAFWFGELGSTALDLLQPWPLPRFPQPTGGGMEAAQAWLGAVAASRTHFLRVASVLLRVVGVSVGAWAAGNASRLQRSSFMQLFLATLVAQLGMILRATPTTEPAATDDADAHSERSWLAILVAVAVYARWRCWSEEALELTATAPDPSSTGVVLEQGSGGGPVAPRRSGGRCRRFWLWTLWCWLLAALTTSYVLNCSLDTDSSAPLKVGLRSAVSSPDAQLLFQQLQQQWAEMRRMGAREWWRSVREQLDLGGVEQSYELLELSAAEGAAMSASQLRRHRNKLALRFHPDKCGESAGLSREQCEVRFAQLQKAYEKIIKTRSAQETRAQAREEKRNKRKKDTADEAARRRAQKQKKRS